MEQKIKNNELPMVRQSCDYNLGGDFFLRHDRFGENCAREAFGIFRGCRLLSMADTEIEALTWFDKHCKWAKK